MKALYYSLYAVLAVLFVLIFSSGAWKHAQTVNTDYSEHDQGAYMYYAQQLHDTNYHYTGRRNRHPMYPLILSLFYKTGTSMDAFFEFGKKFNIGFAILMLGGLFYIFWRFFPSLTAINLFMITAFTVFIFKAPYVQCELLYYFLAFLAFLLIIKLFSKPVWYYALLAGALMGVTWLTKSAVQPALYLLVFWLGLKSLYDFYQKWRQRKQSPFSIKKGITPFISIALVVVSFVLVIWPYIHTSKRIFGKYMYNVNSTFYMWYDSRQEMKSGTRAHGDRTGWPDMPADQIPSAKKYLREHSLSHVMHRIIHGGITSIKAAKRAYGYFWYLFFYLVFFIYMVIKNWKASLDLLKQHFFLVMYLASYFGAYFILNAWWNYLGPSVRHILALFLPFMFIVNLIILMLPDHHIRIAGKRINVYLVFQVAVSLYLIFDLYFILSARLYAMTGGA